MQGGVVGGVAGGVVGGTIGGKPNGVLGGTPGGAGQAPKFVPQFIGAGQKLTGADPPFPVSLRRNSRTYRLLATICVTASGGVDKVTIKTSPDPLLNDGVITTVKGWRFRPYTASGSPIPFCYPATFEFKTE